MADLRIAARNMMKPRFLRAFPDKAASRLSYLRHRAESAEARRWCALQATSPSEYVSAIDGDLAAEARAFGDELRARSAPLLVDARLPFGGGDPQLLYFLVRHLRPQHVVETGVAAGFSSAAVLCAMARNGCGQLWSSELPYVRQAHPEELVGLVVPESVRDRWHLFLDGDGPNLARIRDEVPHIDLLHYDSDKSWRGRARALTKLRTKLGDDSTLVFDDIEDNNHFRQLVASAAPFHIVHCDGRYIGVVPGRREKTRSRKVSP